MSATQSDLSIAITAKVEEALKSFDLLGTKVAKTAKESKGVFGEFTDSIKVGFKDIANFSIGSFIGGAALDLVTGVGRKITDVFNESIEAASSQENAIIKLNNALKLNGGFTEDTSRSFQAYADQLARTTSLEDDVILNQLAMAKTFGATDEQAKKIVETAADMSFALGKDFNTVVLELSQTLEGSAGRLAKYDDRIKGLDASALKAGDAIGIFNGRFSGSASQDLESYAGSMGQLKKSLGEVLETFGGFIINNSLFRDAISGTTKVINNFNDAISKSPTRVEQLNAQLKILNLTKNSEVSKKKIAAINEEIGKQEKLQKIIADNAQRNAADADKLNSLKKKRTDDEEAEKEKVKVLKKSLDELKETLKIAGKSELQILKDKQTEQLKILKESYDKKLLDEKSYNDLVFKNRAAVDKKLKDLAAEKRKDEQEDRQIFIDNEKKLDKQRETALDKAFAQVEKQEKQKEEEKKKRNQGTADIIGLGANVLQGASGVTGLLKGGAAAALGPEIGAALGPVIDALSGGPEQTKALVKSFAEATPVLIEAIIDSIPVLIIELAEQFPVVIDKLVEKIPDFITGFVDQIPFIADALIMQMPMIAVSLIDGIISGIPRIISGMASAAFDAFKNILSTLNPFSSEGGGVFKRIGGALGFANGGEGVVTRVPAGFNNKDSFPSMMKTGEVVLDRSLTTDMRQFLTSQKSGTGSSDAALSTILTAMSAPIVAKAEVKMGNKAFADIFVELKRQNQRLA